MLLLDRRVYVWRFTGCRRGVGRVVESVSQDDDDFQSFFSERHKCHYTEARLTGAKSRRVINRVAMVRVPTLVVHDVSTNRKENTGNFEEWMWTWASIDVRAQTARTSVLPGVRHVAVSVAVSVGLCYSRLASRSVRSPSPLTSVVSSRSPNAGRARFPFEITLRRFHRSFLPSFIRSFDAASEHRIFSSIFHKFTRYTVIRASFSIYSGW